MAPTRSGDRAARLSASAALRWKLALVEGELDEALAALWQPEGLADRYRRYLGAMHQVIRASVPLMELAARRCAERGPEDHHAAALADYLAEHVEEERHHDRWLLEDLAALHGGHAPWPAPEAGPAPALLVGPQYYWIEHGHPVALLGYIAVLEGRAPAEWLAGRLAERTGLPSRAFRTVRAHAVLDGGHTAALDALLDRLPLSSAQEAAIGVSALQTVGALTALVRGLVRPGAAFPASVHPAVEPSGRPPAGALLGEKQ